MVPRFMFGDGFAERAEIAVRQRALESGCFVVCATAWLDADQQAQIAADTGSADLGPISGGCLPHDLFDRPLAAIGDKGRDLFGLQRL
jgi:nitrilase